MGILTRKLRRPAAGLASLLIAVNATAAISRPDLPGSDGTGSELWLNVWDANAEVSYSLDLGVTLAQMRATNSDQGSLSALAPAGNNVSATFQKASDSSNDYAFWIIDPRKDSAWSQFTAGASVADAVWSVMGADLIGPTTKAGQSMQLTVTQGKEAAYRTVTNGMASSLAATILPFVTRLDGFGSHNVTGSSGNSLNDSPEGIAVNGSAYVPKTLDADAYYGAIAGAIAGVDYPGITNAVGQSAWFYEMTRDVSGNAKLVGVNEFDNLAGDAYWGFTAEAGNTGRYLLSYVMPRFVSAAEVTSHVTFENSFAHLAGVLSMANPVGHEDGVLSLGEGFLRRLAQRKQAASVDALKGINAVDLGGQAPVSPVPEPGAAWLLLVGLTTVAGALRRRRAAAPR